MTYYDNHLEPDLVARFNATPDLLPVTGDDAYVMKPNYTDHEGRLNKHYIHSENHERLQIKYWCAILADPSCALSLNTYLQVLRLQTNDGGPRALWMRHTRLDVECGYRLLPC